MFTWGPRQFGAAAPAAACSDAEWFASQGPKSNFNVATPPSLIEQFSDVLDGTLTEEGFFGSVELWGTQTFEPEAPASASAYGSTTFTYDTGTATGTASITENTVVNGTVGGGAGVVRQINGNTDVPDRGIGRYNMTRDLPPLPSTQPDWGRWIEATATFAYSFTEPIHSVGFYIIDAGDFNGELEIELYSGATVIHTVQLFPRIGMMAGNGNLAFWGIQRLAAFDKVRFVITQVGETTDVLGFDQLYVGGCTGFTSPSPEMVLTAPSPSTIEEGETATGGTITNTGLRLADFLLACNNGATVVPESGAIAAGEVIEYTVTPVTDGAHSITLTNLSSGPATGSPASLTVTPVPPSDLVLTAPSPSSGAVGAAATGGTIQNTGTLSATFTLASSPSATMNPSSGTVAGGATIGYTITPSTVGAHSITLTNTSGGTVTSGSPASFTATATDANFANVALLLPMNGTDGSTTITDASSNAFTPTVNGAVQIDTAQSKFGGASALFDGTLDYLVYASNAAFNTGSGNFTIESWVRPAAIGADMVICMRATAAGHRAFDLSMVPGGQFVARFSSNAPALLSLTGTTVATANTWYHVALVRNGNVFTLYVDGVAEATATHAITSYAGADPVVIGGISTGLYSFNGRIDDLRITIGVARYTAAFTPPTAAHPTS